MKKIYYTSLLSFAFILLSCGGMIKLESEGFSTQSYDLEEFTSISVAEGIEVVLHQSFDHRADASSNFMEYLRVNVDDEGNLVIDFDQPANTTFKKNETKVEVWASNVNKFKASSSAELIVDGKFTDEEQWVYASSSGTVEYDVDCSKLTVEVSSSGDYKGDVEVDEFYASASSSGDMEVKGSAKIAVVQATSSGDINAKKMDVEDVEAKVSSSGDIRIGVSKTLKGDVSSKGNLYYKANGTIQMDIEKSSGGDVKEIKGIIDRIK